MKQIRVPAAIAIAFAILGYVLGTLFGLGSVQGRAFLLAALAFGIVLGMLFDWLVEEAARRNRELMSQLERRALETPQIERILIERLQRQISAPSPPASLPASASGSQGQEIAAQTLAEFLHQRDSDLKALREEINDMHQQMQTVRNKTDQEIQAVRAEFDAYVQTHPDNLTVIKGIGPVYQRKLHDLGINSFKQLAEADPDKLRRQLDIKNWQKVNIEDWIAQSRDWL